MEVTIPLISQKRPKDCFYSTARYLYYHDTKSFGGSRVYKCACGSSTGTPDGDFPTVISPNPEEPEALKMAIEIAQQTNADIVIGTDPDCDRLGIAVRNSQGTMEIINGNQAMAIKTNFLLENWKSAGKINWKPIYSLHNCINPNDCENC